MKFSTKMLGSVAAFAMMAGAYAAQAGSHSKEIVVGFFPEWPMPFQAGQANPKVFEDAGLNVKWVSFDAGTAMSAAMASGDVQISVSQGVTPFLTAVSAGQDLVAVDVALTYSDNDNCVVRSSLEITKDNAKELEGKTVAVPLSTAAHTGFLTQMAHFGVDVDKMTIVDMSPVDAAAAFANGNMDMVCGWGGPLARMKQHGNPLVTGAEKEAIVGKVYDVTSTVGSWAKENAETVEKFLAVVHKLNAEFNDGGAEKMMPAIAEQAGMDPETATGIATLGMAFLPIETQLGAEWMGGFMQKNFKEAADKMAEAGSIKAMDSYDQAVDASYLAAASKMMMK
jgi:taurine transport system substrate-binding protein